ncbi:TPA: hypothetical protein VBA85_002071 [Streptococcus agalactiae]|nr:hypothetical protein [Streptococcus agalactiae]
MLASTLRRLKSLSLFWTDAVCLSDAVSTDGLERKNKMTQDRRLIRKQFRLTKEEEKIIQGQMARKNIPSFSEFVRKKVLEEERIDTQTLSYLLLFQTISNLAKDIHRVQVLVEQKDIEVGESLSLILKCVQELLSEIESFLPLSADFKNKYLR